MGGKGMARVEVPTSVHSWEHGRIFLCESQQSCDADVRSLAILHGRDECAMWLNRMAQRTMIPRSFDHNTCSFSQALPGTVAATAILKVRTRQPGFWLWTA